MDAKIFGRLGFTKAETDIYLMLLRRGPSTAAAIAQETRLNRSHIYDSLNTLKEKGLVSSHELNRTLRFTAAKPETLLEYAKEMEKELSAIIPDLRKLDTVEKPRTKVSLFQGKEGIKTVLREILAAKQEYVVFGEEGQFQKIFPIYIRQFLREIVASGIKERLLSREDMRGKLVLSKNTRVRYLPEQYLSPAIIVVYGKAVATFVWSEPYSATVLEDAEVADSYRTYFEQLWRVAKE